MTTVEPAHLEATVADQTPIPAEALDLDAVMELATPLLREAFDEMPPEQAAVTALGRRIRAEVERIYIAGRTAAAADALMAARDDLHGVADRLRVKAKDSGDKTHVGTAAGVDLACFRLVELADRAARVAENGADRGVE
ncbi:hypothetical protein ABGB07_36205 [Micromonosporaceae bacterium B7E4]